MEQRSSSAAPASKPTTENPIVAVGRKVKSALSSSLNQPSVRIYRSSSTLSYPRPPTANTSGRQDARPYAQMDFAEGGNGQTKYNEKEEGNGFASRLRKRFSREDRNKEDPYENEYDTDTVDLLDVMGIYPDKVS